jgi:hypothetical protein
MIKNLISKFSKQAPIHPNSSKNYVDDPQIEVRRNNVLSKPLPKKTLNSGLSASFEIKTPTTSTNTDVQKFACKLLPLRLALAQIRPK